MPTKNNQQVERSSHLMAGAKSPQSEQRPSATLLKRLLPGASVEKAKKIFEKFSLSKFPKDSLPSNYVHPYKRDASQHHAERTKHVQEFQKKKIEQHLHNLKVAEEHQQKADSKTIRGITVALPKDRTSKILPSYNKAKGTIVLEELMDLIAKNTRGTEFHAKGDATLNRLAFLKRIENLKKTLGLDAARGQKRRELE